jgi:hypothetical protein
MALRLGLPSRISAESGPVNLETYPAWATITYEFPARGDLPAVKLTWYEGARDAERNLPPTDLFHGKVPSDSGSLLVGEKGSIFSPSDYGSEQELLGVAHSEDKEKRNESEPSNQKRKGKKPDHDLDHKAEWVRAIRENDPSIAWSSFAYAGRLTEAMLLGNVAVRLGKAIVYDGDSGRVAHCPEAAQYIQPEYRKGWEI